MTRIAIIGAGLAGLTLARQLNDCADVTVFEKSRGFGGRMATRSAPPYAFDHGAQFFTAKTPAFQAQVAEWLASGSVCSWNARFAEFERAKLILKRDWDESHPHYVGVPGMNEIGRQLAKGIEVQLNTQVLPVKRSGDSWQLGSTTGEKLGRFDWVLSTAPAAQTAKLLPGCAFTDALQQPQMLGCCALLLGFAATALPRIDWQAALVREADISWVAVNSSKPGRAAAFSMVVHSTNAYAEASLNANPADVQAHMLHELKEVTGIDAASAEHNVLHRWRYANTPKQSGPAARIDAQQQLGACGDWLIHGRVESAFVSASELATAMRARLLE